jgi:tetratricopeptide (TPR) repeat protein
MRLCRANSIWHLALIAAISTSCPIASGNQDSTAQDYESIVHNVSDMIVSHRYREAEQQLDELWTAYPDSPSVHIQRTILYFSWLDDYGIADSLGGKFSTAVERTISLSDSVLSIDPRNAYVRFFKGSALAYRSLYRSYTEGVRLRNIPSLIGDASDGIHELEYAQRIDPEFIDPLIGIGKYKHWKSQKFPWPFGTRRDALEGISMLERAVREGVEWGAGAAQTLGWIYISEQRYYDALELILPMIDQYPQCRYFKEIAGRAYISMEDYDSAEMWFMRIIDNFSSQERASNYMVMKYERWLAYIDQRRGDSESACVRAQRLGELVFDGVHSSWRERKTKVLNGVLDMCR